MGLMIIKILTVDLMVRPDFVMSHSEDDLQNWRLLFIEPLTDKILAVL
jgi:hypothetical protein